MKENNCICKQCNKDFYKKPVCIKKSKTNLHFCSGQCWNKWLHNKYTFTDKCSFCGKEITKVLSDKKKSKTGKFFCDNICKRSYSFKNRYKGKSLIGKRKLSEYLIRTDANRYTAIRVNAKIIMSTKEQICTHCGYNKRVEVCHIKDISAFTGDTLLEVINAENNLTLLCPNHHFEFDDWKHKNDGTPCPIKLK